MMRSGGEHLRRVRAIADYQFGPGAGEALFPDGVGFVLSNTGRPRQVTLDGARIATVRARDGRLTLSMDGGRRLHGCFPPPRWRVVVSADAAPFVAEGGNAFAKHILRSDPEIRALDEVLVTDPEDRPLAVGQARLGSEEMGVLKRGVAVETRDSVKPR
ncbi:MAG: PUA domain-containing protein [Halobacteria archaeon]